MRKHATKARYVELVILLLVALVVGMAFWRIATRPSSELVAVVRHPKRVMGTDCTVAAVVPRSQSAHGTDVLAVAENALRPIEAQMSVLLAESEISQLNRAAAETPVTLSPEVVELLGFARNAYEETDGVFDVTCRPLVELWKQAAERNRLPTDAEIAEARGQSNWEAFDLGPSSAKKRVATASVDLGGIAKGYAVDRARAAMQEARVAGGLINVGGDVICFGRPPQGQFWKVDVRNPFEQQPLTALHLTEGAVCTSGDYARYRSIEGRQYSHIVDPRTGLPAASVHSATVVAPSGAMAADVWATALSVLGQEGLERLPEGIEALLVVGSPDDYTIYCTPGMLKYLASRLPKKPVVVER